MAAQTLQTIIKNARNDKGWTQEQFARRLKGIGTADIEKLEKGEWIPTQEQLKLMATTLGVTQTSLLEAAKAARAKQKGTAAKTTTKTTATKSTTSKTTAAKTTAAKSAVPASATISMKVTSTEQKLIEYYRAATSDNKKAATKILKGEMNGTLTSLLSGGNGAADAVGDFLGDALSQLLGGK